MVGVIAAAGRGERLGAGTCKALVPLCGRPLIVRTVEALSRSSMVHDIIVVVAPGMLGEFGKVLEGAAKVCRLVEGGKDRVDSVLRGFEAAGDDCDIIAVHDGARPCIGAELTDRVITAARQWGAAIPAIPFVCTAKKVAQDMFVRETIPRRGIWEAQTPQAFKYGLLKDAYGLLREKVEVTDESLLIEMAGKRVKVVEGAYDNIKITNPLDLKLAELILRERRGAGE